MEILEFTKQISKLMRDTYATNGDSKTGLKSFNFKFSQQIWGPIVKQKFKD